MTGTELKSNLTQLSNLILFGYYQTSLFQLSDHKIGFIYAQSHFESTRKKLKRIVSKEPILLSNLNNIADSYDSLHNNVDKVFKYSEIAIKQKNTLSERIDYLKDKAIEIKNLLLEISYNKLARGKLKRAII
jgi:hypothetical protein